MGASTLSFIPPSSLADLALGTAGCMFLSLSVSLALLHGRFLSSTTLL